MLTDRPAPSTAVQRAVQAAPARQVAVAGLTSLALLALAPASALAAAAAKVTGDEKPIDLGDDASQPQVGAGGGGIARVIVGLLVVIAVIYGVTWVLKQIKTKGDAPTGGGGLEAITTMPLQGGAALSLVRVGDELLLLGSGANGATALRRYEEDEARALGLWPEDATSSDGSGPGGGTGNVVAVLGRTVRAMRARSTGEPSVVVQNASVTTSTAVAPTSAAAPVHPAASTPVAYAAPGTAVAPVASVAPGPAAAVAMPVAPASPVAATPASRLLDRVRAMTVRS